MSEKFDNVCGGCNDLLALTSLKKDQESGEFTVSLLPKSRHLAFYREGETWNIRHLHCTGSAIAEKIPEESITDFSKLNKKKVFQVSCTICMESESVWLYMMPCTHILCYGCYQKWNEQSNKCPTCNSENYGLKKHFNEYLKVPKLSFQCTAPPLTKKSKTEDPKTVPVTWDSKLPVLERQSSAPLTQGSLSTPAYDNSHCSTFNTLKMKVLDPDNPVVIDQVSKAKEIGDFSDLKQGTGSIFISAITEKPITHDYNDLVMTSWKFDVESKTYKVYDFLNFYKTQGKDSVKHSGDNFETIMGVKVLQHGIYIPREDDAKIAVHFVNENVEGSDITSIEDCKQLHKAFGDSFAKLTPALATIVEKPKIIIACSQATFVAKNKLKDLSKNYRPSCGLIMDGHVHACDWTDETNMTVWGFVFLY